MLWALANDAAADREPCLLLQCAVESVHDESAGHGISSTRKLLAPQHAVECAFLSDSQLEFEISDSRIQEIGSCETHMGGLLCVVQVSIVDIVLLHHFSVSITLELHRAAALAITSTQTSAAARRIWVACCVSCR